VRFKLFLYGLIYFVIRVFVCLVQAMRIETCHGLARQLAILSYDILRIRREVVDDNLGWAFPELAEAERQRLARSMWEHIFLLVCEIVHVPRKIHETNWRDYIRIPQQRTMVRYLLDPRPLVIVSGHFGNFEVGGVVAGLLGYPTFTVARPLDNPYLHRFINRFRGARGQFILPKIGSAPQVDAILRTGGTLAFLGDQHAGRNGCWVNFFGRPASCHKAVALFSLTQNAPLLLSYAVRRGGPLQFEVGQAGIFDPSVDKAEDVRSLTQWYNQRLEAAIRTAPEQYWWLHRRWKDTRPERRLAAAARRRDPPDATAPAPHRPAAHRTPQPAPARES